MTDPDRPSLSASPAGRPLSLADTWRIYTDPGREAGALRAAHTRTIVRLSPALLMANVVNALVMLWAYAREGGVPWTMLVWVALMSAYAVVTGVHAWRGRDLRPIQVSARTVRRATVRAALLASVWVIPASLWYPAATHAQQLLWVALVAGTMGVGAFVLSPLLPAALVYLSVFTAGSVVALLRTPEIAVTVVVMMLVYAVIVSMGAIAAARVATTMLRAQRDAAAQQRTLAVLLQDFEEHAGDALWEIDQDGRLTHASMRLAELLQLPQPSMLGGQLIQLLQRQSEQAARALQATLERPEPFRELRLCLPRGDGEQWWRLAGKPLHDEQGGRIGWRGVLTDVTAVVQAEQRLTKLAHHDALTGLANRLTLHETLSRTLADGVYAALLSIDLDQFKAVNDTQGHGAGDAVLMAVAARLRQCVRPGDLVARLGGDEFAVLLAPLQRADEAEALAARLVQTMQDAVEVSGRPARVGASVGVALLPEHGRSVDELMAHVDLALYHAKAAGRGRWVMYTPALAAQNRRELQLEQSVRLALRDDALMLAWQPQVESVGGAIGSAEATLRWRDEVLAGMEPQQLLRAAERAGLALELAVWVLQRACDEAVRSLPDLDVAVNVSPAQLCDPGFVERLRRVLAASGLEPARLSIEVSELALQHDPVNALAQIHAVRACGVRVVLDHFGCGQASLTLLRQFPFHALKVDRSLVDTIASSREAQAVVRAICDLARVLGMRVVADGVQTPAQWRALVGAGCHAVQGELMLAPGPIERLAELRSPGHAVPWGAMAVH